MPLFGKKVKTEVKEKVEEVKVEAEEKVEEVKEAVEEARYVLKLVKGFSLDLPIVYDPETIPGGEARTADVTGKLHLERVTRNDWIFVQLLYNFLLLVP